MERFEEEQSNNSVENKITTFASPAVLAAILDEEPSDEDVNRSVVASNSREEETERVTDSLESSLNDSLEFSKLEESIEPKRDGKSTMMQIESSQVEISDDVSDFPKSSTPLLNDHTKPSEKYEKPPKPRKPQHIIERNKERVGKKIPERTSYAQVHAIKTRKKVEKIKASKSQGEEAAANVSGSGLGSGSEGQSQHSQKISNDLSQRSVSPVHHENEQEFLRDSYSEKSLDTFHNQPHGPYYDVSQNFGSYYNPLESNYSDLIGYSRGCQNATANSRQAHAMAGSFQPTHYASLSTQSAPPGVYGYQRPPLISNIHNFHGEDFYLSSAFSNIDFQNSQKVNKLPESSLHRTFSSEPYLANPGAPSFQSMADIDRNSKASGSYSSVKQPLSQYKPYSLKDYRNFVGSEAERAAGGLGPNIDTNEFKEKMRKVSKQREYAAVLRAQHSTMKKQQERKGAIQQPVKPKHVKQAEAKRQAALNYAKNVPRPKQMINRRRGSPGMGGTQADKDQEITNILEILRLRHEKEKKEVDTIRKDLASKIRL